jgi:hypothetical protein
MMCCVGATVTDAWAEDDFFGEDRRATSEERER